MESNIVSSSTQSIAFNIQKQEAMVGFAKYMSKAHNMIKPHFRGNVGDCLAIVMKAAKWNMCPFEVAQSTYLIKGNIGYEGKLVNAIAQSSGIIEGTFKYEYEGEGSSLSCRVGAKVKETGEFLWGEWLTMMQVKTKNSPLWQSNPKLQFGYLQVRNWVRAYFPSVIMGVYTTDELQQSDMPKKEININKYNKDDFEDFEVIDD